MARRYPLQFETARSRTRTGWAAFHRARDGFLHEQLRRRGRGTAYATYRPPDGNPLDCFLVPEDLRHHALVLGATGSGKSSLLEALARGYFAAKQGFTLFDPHGDLFTRVAAWGLHGSANMTLLDFSQPDLLLGWNPLTPWPDVDAGRQVECLVGVLKRLYADEAAASWAWGVKVHEIMTYALRACIESALPATLVDLRSCLLLPVLRHRLLATASPETRDYFLTRFGKREMMYVSAVLNKLDPFLGSLAVQRFLGTPTSTLDLFNLVNTRGALLVNLAKGALGPTADVLGRLLVNVLQLAALRRAAQPMASRHPYALLLDEAHTLAGPESGLEDLLVSARKYKVFVTLAAQSLSLFPARARPHLLGNTGRQWFFRLPHSEARLVADDLFESQGSWWREAIRPYDTLDDPLLTPAEELRARTRELANLPVGACYWALKGQRYKGRRIQITAPERLPYRPGDLADRLRGAMLRRLHPPDARDRTDVPF